MSEIGHNTKATNDRLRLLIERWERLDEERQGIVTDQRDVMAEAKAVGYDPKIMRECIKIRKQDPNDRREHNAILETYLSALGIV